MKANEKKPYGKDFDFYEIEKVRLVLKVDASQLVYIYRKRLP